MVRAATQAAAQGAAIHPDLCGLNHERCSRQALRQRGQFAFAHQFGQCWRLLGLLGQRRATHTGQGSGTGEPL